MTTDNKQPVLTNEQIKAIARSMVNRRYPLAFARAIEQAVLSKLRGTDEAVGKVVLFGDELKEVSWENGKLPPVGTELYAAPQASVEVNPNILNATRADRDYWRAQALKAEQDRAEARNAALEEAAKVPRAYAEQLERMGWDKRFPDELCAIFNASTNMADQILALKSAPAAEPETMDEILRRERDRAPVVLPKDPTLPEDSAKGAGDVALPPLPEPDSYLFQHEETGITHFVDGQQVEWGFEENNPRLQRIGGMFSESQMRAYVLADRQQRGGDVDERAAFERWFNPDDGKNYWDCWQAACRHSRAALASQKPVEGDAPDQSALDALINVHQELVEDNPYCYFELAHTRQTGWMAWITDKPLYPVQEIANPDRKVIARGQGDSAEEACRNALAAIAQQGKESGS